MNRVRFPVTAIGLLLCSSVALAQLPGAVTTVNAAGTPQVVFSDKSEVFFTAGPTATPCAFTQYLNDGRYYFQVTDLMGTRLFSTDPVAERVVTIRRGVLFSYDGHTHVTRSATAFAPFLKNRSSDESTAGPESGAALAQNPCGGIEVGLAPFSDAGDRDADYLLWLTPIGLFSGDAAQVDPSCGAGCFHGFRPEFSLTASFRVEDKRFCEESFCVSGVKFEDRNGDGIRDSGEPALPGVEIRAEGESGPLLRGVTGGDGAFEVCGLSNGGEFIVFEIVPFGYRQTGPIDDRRSQRLIARDLDYIVLGCDEDFEGLDFGNQLIPNAIGGIKFEDLNANGARDPGEPGLAGFVITLTSTATGGPAPQSVTTDANGNFLFLNVAPGSYVLSETFRQGFSLTVPANNAINVTLASGGSSIANVFGNFRGVLTGTITGAKFNDFNGNGVRDPGEPGIAGVTITRTSTINDPAGVQLSVVTDAQGNFTFANVPFGTFTISETVPAGFVQTFPPAPGTATANVNFAQRNVTGLLFGNRAIGTITGFKFNDVNGNGVRDAGEPGLAGVAIRRTSSPSDPVGATLTVTTGADGAFTFSNVPLGIYTLSETVPAGFVQTAPPPPGTISVTLTPTQPGSSNNLFGNRAAAVGVSGIKFNDVNGNGVRDAGEPGLAGVTIRLTNAAGVVTTATTDASGAFNFAGVVAGTYTVSEVVPAGFQQTAPAAPGTFAITVVEGQAVTGLLFGNRAVTPGAGSISGRKILDINGNGVFEPAIDRGFEGIVFELRSPSGALVATATSDAQGNFTFSNLSAGTYVLSEILPENFFQTFPGTPEAPGTYTITLTSGQAATGFLFLNKC